MILAFTIQNDVKIWQLKIKYPKHTRSICSDRTNTSVFAIKAGPFLLHSLQTPFRSPWIVQKSTQVKQRKNTTKKPWNPSVYRLNSIRMVNRDFTMNVNALDHDLQRSANRWNVTSKHYLCRVNRRLGMNLGGKWCWLDMDFRGLANWNCLLKHKFVFRTVEGRRRVLPKEGD